MGKDYVGKCKECGCVEAACAERVPRDDLAKALATMVKIDLSIERMDSEDIRNASWKHTVDCPNYESTESQGTLFAANPGEPQ